MSNLVFLENVTVLRGQRRALEQVSFRIAQGEHVAILGPNGCGKTTLIRTLNREFYPLLTEGKPRLEILGRSEWNVWDLRKMIGIVSNDLADIVRRDITGREVVLSGFFASIGLMMQRPTAEQEARADAVIRELHIEHLAERWVDEMSSGEVRRLVLGRSLVHDPPAVLLDEPSNSLDFAAQQQLRSLMSGIAQRGKSLLVVTHELQDVVPEIERVILIRQGKVFADGPKQDILTTEWMRKLFEIDLTVVRNGDRYSIV